MTEDLKAAYLVYLTYKINDLDYSDIDSFLEDHNISTDYETMELLNLPLKVIEIK
jgi:hypothetical protein